MTLSATQAQRGTLLYEGKAKRIYDVVGQPEMVWMEFKDDLTAFNAQKKGSFAGKGQVNLAIAQLIFQQLEKAGVKTHLVSALSASEWLAKKVQIIPLEVVVRNRLAGSTAKKFEIVEGTRLEKPLVEFYYKKDEWNDPFLSDDQALMLKAVPSQKELDELKRRALTVNSCLKQLFAGAGLDLIDFKIEFGFASNGDILLADEISPDSCRLWDVKTEEKFDKDRFRRDLGKVEESYQEVLRRLKSAQALL